VRGDSYNRVERWLHWLALEPKVVRELSFDLERQFTPSRQLDAHPRGGDRPVYVCGLARSGTTILLRALAKADAFRSLTYRDMPFVLAPNLWRRIAGRSNRQLPAAERAHGDGILVDFDSPEAFEEVFWRTFNPQPATQGAFGSVPPTDEAMEAFAQYRALVAAPRRYLSKNNNNLVRLAALRADPSACVMVVYRDPVEAARSLFRQHQRFTSAHRDARFTRAYMSWLAHHEFGLDHRPFAFAVSRMQAGLAPDHPDYWLDYWDAVHRHVLGELAPGIHLVDHDRLCEKPAEMLASVLAIAGVEADAGVLGAEIRAAGAARQPPAEFSPEIRDRAFATHAALRSHPVNVR
jgi:hypothetical protein